MNKVMDCTLTNQKYGFTVFNSYWIRLRSEIQDNSLGHKSNICSYYLNFDHFPLVGFWGGQLKVLINVKTH